MLMGLILVGAALYTLFNYWPYIFSRKVEGVVSDVQRIETPVALIGGSTSTNTKDLFSFAVAIREKSGEIVTASSEDRQWAVVKAGFCAEARYYPYPPWDLSKSGTYFNARLVKLYACDTGELAPMNSEESSTQEPVKTPQPSDSQSVNPQEDH